MTILKNVAYAEVADKLTACDNFYRAVITEVEDQHYGQQITTPFGSYFITKSDENQRPLKKNDVVLLYGRKTGTSLFSVVSEADNTVFFFDTYLYSYYEEARMLTVPSRKTLADIPLDLRNRYEDWELTDVSESKNSAGEIEGWFIGAHGCGTFCKKPITHEVPTPKVGDIMRVYTRGLGSTINGFSLGDTVYRMDTDDELWNDSLLHIVARERQAEIDLHKNLTQFDERFAKLPKEMQDRIAKFRRNNPTFRRDFEAMELSISEQAIAISNYLKKEVDACLAQAEPKDGDETDPKKLAGEIANSFYELSYEQQKTLVPEIDSGHSGNSFGCLMKLAFVYTVKPEQTNNVRGVMTPLVGAVAYGDLTQDEYDALKAKEEKAKEEQADAEE